MDQSDYQALASNLARANEVSELPNLPTEYYDQVNHFKETGKVALEGISGGFATEGSKGLIKKGFKAIGKKFGTPATQEALENAETPEELGGALLRGAIDKVTGAAQQAVQSATNAVQSAGAAARSAAADALPAAVGGDAPATLTLAPGRLLTPSQIIPKAPQPATGGAAPAVPDEELGASRSGVLGDAGDILQATDGGARIGTNPVAFPQSNPFRTAANMDTQPAQNAALNASGDVNDTIKATTVVDDTAKVANDVEKGSKVLGDINKATKVAEGADAATGGADIAGDVLTGLLGLGGMIAGLFIKPHHDQAIIPKTVNAPGVGFGVQVGV